jgi:glutaminyl-peptide cyclotransferase
MRTSRAPLVAVLSTMAALGGLAVWLLMQQVDGRAGQAATQSQPLDTPFDGQRSYQLLQDVCALGPRCSGSAGMLRQQEMLVEYFKKLGGQVRLQKFEMRHPLTGETVPLANLIVAWYPERKERILLACHYDTRPFPDEDPVPARRRGTFVGANDGASGVAVLGELAHHMSRITGKFGVDFVLLDAEEFVFDRSRDEYFIGSDYFARQYASQPPDYRYVVGLLLDMVGDADLQIYQERNSLQYARAQVLSFWKTAAGMGVSEFIARPRHDIRDDHLALNDIGHIPTFDVIDFDYPRPGARVSYWHTEADTPDKCSAASLAKVGAVVLRWLEQQR